MGSVFSTCMYIRIDSTGRSYRLLFITVSPRPSFLDPKPYSITRMARVRAVITTITKNDVGATDPL